MNQYAITQFLLSGEYSDQEKRNQSLARLSADWEASRTLFTERVTQADWVAEMLADRCETEMSYAMRLDRIANLQTKSTMGCELAGSALTEEIECFKASCAQRSKQALEVSHNVHQDCVLPLRKLIKQ